MTLDVVSRDTVGEAVRAQARAARACLPALAEAAPERRARALTAAASALRDRRSAILEANAADLAFARDKGIRASLIDRLQLDETRIEGMAAGLEAIAAFPDPVGRVRDAWTRPNGLRIERVSVPLGVIGIIYESRPNVTADAGGLCLKAGNAAILRGGSESLNSSRLVVDCLGAGLAAAGLPEAAVQLVQTRDREAVGALLALHGLVDVIVPRGGRGLIERVMRETHIPVIAHLDGLCHVYVDGAADPARARAIVVNAKMRRTSVCGAAETVLIDRALPRDAAAAVVRDLIEAGCEVRGDVAIRALDPHVLEAGPADWDTEYLDAIVSVREVDGVAQAIEHIGRHGSHHTDAIVTEDATAAERFLGSVDSAIVLHNASTQFADGGEFGMGAEIGISTGRLHARGPVGAEQLTSFKYVVRGDGQIRP